MDEKPTQPTRWDALKRVLRGPRPTESEPGQAQPAETAPAAPQAAIPAQDTTSPPSPCTDDQDRLEALYRVSRVLGTSLDLDEVLAQVMDAVIDLTGAERGILVMIDNEAQDWNLRLARNIDPDKLDNWEAEVSRTILNTAMQTRQGIVTADAQSDPRFSTQASVIFNVLRSMMCAPLLARGRVIGAIYVDSRIQKDIFSADDLEMLDAFATQAAFAIDNARIYTRTVQQVQKLTIELDEVKRAKQVAEITESEYFRKLQAKVQDLRDHQKKTQTGHDEP
jgi:GAF domain-containing protein